MRNLRTACIFLLSLLVAACGAIHEPAEKTIVPDAAPAAGSRYHYAISVTRRSELPAEVAKEKAPEALRLMDFNLQGDVTVSITEVTASGYDLHWQADLTEPAPNTKPGAFDDIVRQKHLFELNLPVDVSIDLRHARPDLSIRNIADLRRRMFIKARELLGAKAVDYGCADESEQTRCPLVRGSEARLASTIASEISPMFACSSRRLGDASLTHWREVRRGGDNNLEMAIELNVHNRETDVHAGTMRLQLEAILDAESFKAADEATEVVGKMLRGTRVTADCTISTTSAMPFAVDFVERVANTSPDVVVSSTVHFDRR
jgi:hypothetical protein